MQNKFKSIKPYNKYNKINDDKDDKIETMTQLKDKLLEYKLFENTKAYNQIIKQYRKDNNAGKES